MHDERGMLYWLQVLPPVSVLGLDGAATCGDKFNVFEDEKKRSKLRLSVLINA
jgi:translation initiation factor IF-2